jgi:hypothetical protein
MLQAKEFLSSMRERVSRCPYCQSTITAACEVVMKDAQSEQNRITIRYEDLERGVSNGCEDCELVLSALMSFYPNRLQCPTQIDILTQSTNYMYEHYRRVRSEPFWRPGYLLAPETDYRKENHGKHQLWVALSIPKRYWSDTYHGWDEEGPSSTCIDIFRSHGRLFCFATRHTVEDDAVQSTTAFVNSSVNEFSASHELAELAALAKPQWGNILSRALPSEDTSSEQAYQTIQGWICDCLQDHENCSKQSTSSLPKRVLRLEGNQIQLRETEGTLAKYACLSHCWGVDGPSLRLTRATLEHLKRGIERQKLPKTFSTCCGGLG